MPTPAAGSGGVVVQFDGGARDHFAVVVMAAGRADMVRTLQLAAGRSFIGIAGDERVMRAALVAAGTGHAVLLNGHVNL